MVLQNSWRVTVYLHFRPPRTRPSFSLSRTKQIHVFSPSSDRTQQQGARCPLQGGATCEQPHRKNPSSWEPEHGIPSHSHSCWWYCGWRVFVTQLQSQVFVALTQAGYINTYSYHGINQAAFGQISGALVLPIQVQTAFRPWRCWFMFATLLQV